MCIKSKIWKLQREQASPLKHINSRLYLFTLKWRWLEELLGMSPVSSKARTFCKQLRTCCFVISCISACCNNFWETESLLEPLYSSHIWRGAEFYNWEHIFGGKNEFGWRQREDENAPSLFLLPPSTFLVSCTLCLKQTGVLKPVLEKSLADYEICTYTFFFPKLSELFCHQYITASISWYFQTPHH